MIAVDQDKLGKQGHRVAKDGTLEVWTRPLDGGDVAVGLFNRGPEKAKVTAKWGDLQITGKHKVRDLWAHKDGQSSADSYSAEVPAHGVVLIRVKK